MKLSEFDYDLPKELIAQFPSAERSASRLLVVKPSSLLHSSMAKFSDLLLEGDVLVFNDTKVVKARLTGKKLTGGRAEILLERSVGKDEALCQMKVSKPVAPGGFIEIADVDGKIEVLGRSGEFYHLRFPCEPLDFFEEHGQVPLPPYIERDGIEEIDPKRYQTVYAKNPGAVAAPTAGLHFSNELMESIARKGIEISYVTLHVGSGTFKPVRAERIEEHEMHSEWFNIPRETATSIQQAKSNGGRVICVGTTSLRALESAWDGNQVAAGWAETSIFIYPGYQFNVVDALLTNFHLPKSTLMMLVSAFAGKKRIFDAYDEAIREGYRFFSYGDAMFLRKNICSP